MTVKKISIIEQATNIKDKTNFNEKFDQYDNKPVHGYVVVKAYDKDNNEVWKEENHNLVVTVGRSWLMQKAFDENYDSQSVKHEFLTWFSVGNGGANSSTPFTTISPNDSDTDLFSKVKFGTDPSTYADGGYKKAFTSLTFTDSTTAKLILTVDYNEANTDMINEIGLFASNSSDPASATEFTLFSHATFPSHPKSTSVKLEIEWYFLF